MTFPLKHPRRIVSSFSEPRPLSLPPEKRTLIHGAWDIAVPVGSQIIAPEDGQLLYANIYRSQKPVSAFNGGDLFWPDGSWFAHSRFYNDIYGALIILYTNHRAYLFAHINQTQWWERYNGVDKKVIKEDYDRWVLMFSNMRDMPDVEEGMEIGISGDEGSSFGPHVHMSVHKGRTWDRIDPATIWDEGEING